jgi:hypothetical protein
MVCPYPRNGLKNIESIERIVFHSKYYSCNEVQESIPMDKIVLVTTPTCAKCKILKSKMTPEQMAKIEIWDASDSDVLAELAFNEVFYNEVPYLIPAGTKLKITGVENILKAI